MTLFHHTLFSIVTRKKGGRRCRNVMKMIRVDRARRDEQNCVNLKTIHRDFHSQKMFFLIVQCIFGGMMELGNAQNRKKFAVGLFFLITARLFANECNT